MIRNGATSFAATESGAREGIDAVMAGLAADALPASASGNVEIVVAEVINNIVEHAYAGAETGDIRVRYALSATTLTMEFLDTGKSYPDEALPPGRPADLSVDRESMPEGGFGWLLIRELTSGLSYERLDGCNRLGVRFDLAGMDR